MSKFQPVMKWSGSKRSQAFDIVNRFPKKIKTYYEPFCGGCSVLRCLLERQDIEVGKYVCSDLNKDLIGSFLTIKLNPSLVLSEYDARWRELNRDDDLDRKKRYFEMIRKRLNERHSPYDFIFIMRTTTNGMPRYNSNGEFNNSFHITRNGIEPSRFEKTLNEWSFLLKKHDVQFVHRSYSECNPQEGDFVYLDPPYAGTKGMYFGNFNVESLFGWIGELRNRNVKYAMSFDGKAGYSDFTYNVPEHLYDIHEYIKSGNSSFRRVIGKDKHCIVNESLYIG